jgi:hypothetical protein
VSALDLVPMCMRTWPWIRHYYWQADEIARIEVDVERYQRLFRGDHE